MILHITSVNYISAYQLGLKFNNGSSGIVDLEQHLWGAMFEPLRNLDLFSLVELDVELDTVVWPNGADLAPEFLHDLLQQSQGNSYVG